MQKNNESMSGKICMVTGANTGIGKATALGLAERGATVVMVCRNRVQGKKALAQVKKKSGNESISLLMADLASQASIRALASEFKSQFQQLHVLINNACIITPTRILTEDNIETQFAVNHLAYFMMTNLLLDVITTSTPARIINVASAAHFGITLDFDDVQSSKQDYEMTRIYGQTKFANVLFTYELARRLEDKNITVNCLHPLGAIATNSFADYSGLPRYLRFIPRLFGRTPEKGAETSVYLATSPEVANVTGQYFIDKKAQESSKASYDKEAAARLWKISEEMIGIS